MEKIMWFNGKYYFLSNFYMAPVTYDGITYTNNEAAFQSAKTLDMNLRKEFSKLSPRDAKRKGRHISLRSDWEHIKTDIMYDVCKAKFDQNIELRAKLMDTAGKYLEEGTLWGDTIWGTYYGKGENRLGKILMKIRDEYLKEDKGY